MRSFFQKINTVFIQIVLIGFYVFIIGFASLIYRIASERKEKKESFWQEIDNNKESIKYYESAY